MTHPDVVRVYDDHPVIRLESQLLEVGIDRAHTPALPPDDATWLCFCDMKANLILL
jgi:hypothetical protein